LAFRPKVFWSKKLILISKRKKSGIIISDCYQAYKGIDLIFNIKRLLTV